MGPKYQSCCNEDRSHCVYYKGTHNYFEAAMRRLAHTQNAAAPVYLILCCADIPNLKQPVNPDQEGAPGSDCTPSTNSFDKKWIVPHPDEYKIKVPASVQHYPVQYSHPSNSELGDSAGSILGPRTSPQVLMAHCTSHSLDN